MQEIHITDYLLENTQEALAAQLGLIQPTISRMLAAKRDIVLTIDKRGRIKGAVELRPVGKFARENGASN